MYKFSDEDSTVAKNLRIKMISLFEVNDVKEVHRKKHLVCYVHT